MLAKISLAVSVGVALIAGTSYASSANAQGASVSSLADQLKAHYKLAKIISESDGYKVAEPGTMLVIQKDGIFGVPLGNNAVDPVIYAIQKDPDLHHSNAGANTWKFGVGHKVYLSKLDIDAKHEKVFFTIVECDSSNPVKPSFYKSIIDFEFPNGYLAAAEAGQIEDVISQILTLNNGTDEVQPAHGGQTPSAVLANGDIIKLVQAKLPDSVVIAKIKSSNCDFDTSTDALIKLKQAGVSEPVLQAILDAGAQSNPSATNENPPTVSTDQEKPRSSVCADYDACIRSGATLFEGGLWDQSLARFQEASQLDPSKGEAWSGMGKAYFQMGQYDDAVNMWDKALQLGSTLSIDVCHAGATCGDTGKFLLTMREVSFVNRKEEKEFTAAPSAVTSEGAILFSGGNAYYLQIRFGKNWRFYYTPKSVRGGFCLICPEPGPTQQKIFADYVHNTLVRMAAGDFGSQPSKP